MGATAFLLEEGNRMWLAILGAAILIGLALRYIFRPQYFEEGTIKLGALNLSGLFSKGFLVNFVNPFVFVVWIGIIGYGENKFEDQTWLFLTGTLIGIFLTDNLKAFYAAKLKKFLSHKRLKTVYTITGGIFILFSLRLLYYAFVIS